jgi:hypothetical protein
MKPLPYTQNRAIVPFPAVLSKPTARLNPGGVSGCREPVLLSDDYVCATGDPVDRQNVAREGQFVNPQENAAAIPDESLNLENFLKIEKLQRALKASQQRLLACERALCGALAREGALRNRLAEISGNCPAVIASSSATGRIARNLLAMSSSISRLFTRSR